MPTRRNWSREEHLLAFHLYNQLPFGKLHQGRPEVQNLAKLIDRSPGSVALKLVNFARLDPTLQARGIRGMGHGAKGEEEVWQAFADDPESLAFEAEKVSARFQNRELDQGNPTALEGDVQEGQDRESWVKQRVNQQFFRRRVLSAYDYRCCVTGMRVPDLLIASHIVPWAEDKKNRLNPRNGLCLNPFHDRAFDRHLMWIDEDFRIHFRMDLRTKHPSELGEGAWLVGFEGKRLILPKDFEPDAELLLKHASYHEN